MPDPSVEYSADASIGAGAETSPEDPREPSSEDLGELSRAPGQDPSSVDRLETSPRSQRRDPSVSPAGDPSLVDRASRAARRLCAWCKDSLQGRQDQKFCSVQCRQASWRYGVKPSPESRGGDRPATGALRIAYADPPYPGKAGYYPENQEVDHASLLQRLARYDGWALSTSSAALSDVLSLCPRGVRVCVWVRSCRATRSAGPLNCWEPLIVSPGRPLATDVVQDLADVLDYRGRFRAFPGALVGMKPPQFAVWMFRLVGLVPGDDFQDLFPGSGAVTEAWDRFTGEDHPNQGWLFA